MAWRSSGTTNDEMVDKMKRFGVISTPAIEDAFRRVDRAFFVPVAQKDRAHLDQPLREGNIHISAPHIYGSVLEALELRQYSSLSFLNVGSGTGYLSCLAATILGNHSNNYGVDIFEDVVNHSRAAMECWGNAVGRPVPHIEWIHGNALNINPEKGEAVVGFDRIYVGASVGKEDLPKLAFLLRPGGILVGPVEDELMKVVRIGSRLSPRKNSAASMMETDDLNPLPPAEFTQQVLSGVRFAALLQHPSFDTILPSTIWNPSIHHQYPDSFRHSCREILLCSNSSKLQNLQNVKYQENVNVAGLLPRVLWMEILSYTHRDWFESPESETDFLRRRLLEEQESAQRAHQARMEAEARCQMAEEERDVYRGLARRYQLRLEAALCRSGRNEEAADSDLEDDDEDVGEALVPLRVRVLSGREQAVIFGLGAMLRSIHYESGGDDDDDEDDDSDEEDGNSEADIHIGNQAGQGSNREVAMEDDTSIQEEEDMEDQGEDGNGNNSEESEDDSRTSFFPLGADAMMPHSSASALVVLPQRRTVSITGEDL